MMQIHVQVSIDGTREDVWTAITDIEGAAGRISGIEQVEILELPESGLKGLKWKETRTMFGKKATEIMWITDVVDKESYDVRAESHGSVYKSRLSISEQARGLVLSMDFRAEPQSLLAKLMSILMAPLFKGATERALRQDLEDIKAAVEK